MDSARRGDQHDIHSNTLPTEIISLIFEFLEDEGRDESLSAFAYLARCCQAFTGLALDRLWKTQATLAPLIRCMPQDLWVMGDDNKLTFCRPLVETDWIRFDEYQSKILQLGIAYYVTDKPPETSQVEADTFRALVAYRPAKNFLPNLQTWEFTGRWPEILPFIGAFIGPQLRSVTLDLSGISLIGESGLQVSTALLSLARLSKNIQSLTHYDETDGLYEPLRNLIMNLPHLRSLDVDLGDFDDNILAYLGGLPALQKLYKTEVYPEPEHIELFATDSGRFLSLNELSIGVYDYAAFPAILNRLQRPLQLFSIEIWDQETDYNTRATMLAQASSLLHQYHQSSLKKLNILASPQNTLMRTRNDHALLKALRPLFGIPSLTRLDITSCVVESLGDSWIADAADAWPRLQTLALRHPIRKREAPTVTLAGLAPMLRRCVHLNFLNLKLALKPLDTKTLEGVRNTHLTALHLDYYSTVVHPYHVFRTLVNMFPNLKNIITHHYVDPELKKDMKTLEDLFTRTLPIKDS